MANIHSLCQSALPSPTGEGVCPFRLDAHQPGSNPSKQTKDRAPATAEQQAGRAGCRACRAAPRPSRTAGHTLEDAYPPTKPQGTRGAVARSQIIYGSGSTLSTLLLYSIMFSLWKELPMLFLKRKIRQMDAEERVGASRMYREYWLKWARDQLAMAKKPFVFSRWLK